MLEGWNINKKEKILSGVLAFVCLVALYWTSGGRQPKPKLFSGGAHGSILMQGGSYGRNLGQFDYPRGIAVDAAGDFYVADSRNHRIQKFRAEDSQLAWSTGELGHAEGDPQHLATENLGKFNEPNGVALDADGKVYVVDTWNSRIQILDPKNGKVKKVITSADGFFGPREVVVDRNGFVYVADTGRHRVLKFGPTGDRIRVLGSPKGKGSADGEFNEPIGLALDNAGNLYVADRLNFRIQVFDANGQMIRKFPVDGWSAEQIDMEPHLAIDASRDRLYASDGRNKQILRFALDGKRLPPLSKDDNGQDLFGAPIGVAVGPDGSLFVTDAKTAKVMKLKPE
jgi:DNA-binding beta-propeller fold protein YncE